MRFKVDSAFIFWDVFEEHVDEDVLIGLIPFMSIVRRRLKKRVPDTGGEGRRCRSRGFWSGCLFDGFFLFDGCLRVIFLCSLILWQID